jgi:hypothetical protein
MPKVEFVCPEHGVRHAYDTRIFSPNLHEIIRDQEASVYCDKCGKRLVRNEYNDGVNVWVTSNPFTCTDQYWSYDPPV